MWNEQNDPIALSYRIVFCIYAFGLKIQRFALFF